MCVWEAGDVLGDRTSSLWIWREPGFRYGLWVGGSQRAGVSKSGEKGPGGMPNSRELSGTCLYHEGPSGRRVLDQLHLPRTKRHQSRHRLVSGAPQPKPQAPSSLTPGQGGGQAGVVQSVSLGPHRADISPVLLTHFRVT